MAQIDYEKYTIVAAHTTVATPYSLKKDADTKIITAIAGNAGVNNGGLFKRCPQADYISIYADKDCWVRFVRRWINVQETSAETYTAFFPVRAGASPKDALKISVSECLDIEVLNESTNTTLEVFVSRG